MRQLLLVFSLIGTLVTFGQPQAFKYQAVVRDAAGDLVVNQSVSFQISILEGDFSGPAVYIESHNVTTSAYGSVSLEIGRGQEVSFGDFSTIDWGGNSHFVQVAWDLSGGMNYEVAGVSQLLSVPYALYAGEVYTQPKSEIEVTNYQVTESFCGNQFYNISLVVPGVSFQHLEAETYTMDIEKNGSVIYHENKLVKWSNNEARPSLSTSGLGLQHGDQITVKYRYEGSAFNAYLNLDRTLVDECGGNGCSVNEDCGPGEWCNMGTCEALFEVCGNGSDDDNDGLVDDDDPDCGSSEVNSVYVDLNAGSSGDGSKGSPFITIEEAVNSGESNIFITSGVYDENISWTSDIKIYGGYSSAWEENEGVTLIESQTPQVFESLQNILFYNVDFKAKDNLGGNSIAVVVSNSSFIRFKEGTIESGQPGDGLPGVEGSVGRVGAVGSNGNTGCEDSPGFCGGCATPVGGAGGQATWGGFNGGAGGQPGKGTAPGLAGSSGLGGGNNGGAGGLTTSPGLIGGIGAVGSTGTKGVDAALFGNITGFNYVPSIAGNGAKGGNGQGGGGGGGGGGQIDCDSYGGSGAGGGSGGEGGSPGTGGRSGFASMAVVLLNAMDIEFENTLIKTASGGTGGTGGAGGDGGAGGNGGMFAPASSEQEDGGVGGRGGQGGKGGQGGAGGDGKDGPSIGILSDDTSIYNELGLSFDLPQSPSTGLKEEVYIYQ